MVWIQVFSDRRNDKIDTMQTLENGELDVEKMQVYSSFFASLHTTIGKRRDLTLRIGQNKS